MKLPEAIDICERWFAHIEHQKQRSIDIQKLATMARNGQGDEARHLLAQIDRSPKVYDGAMLEPAVRELVKLARLQVQSTGDHNG